eukprot:COSAG01_NODE_24823_length_765_cov_0.849850_2_plen_200_part_01
MLLPLLSAPRTEILKIVKDGEGGHATASLTTKAGFCAWTLGMGFVASHTTHTIRKGTRAMTAKADGRKITAHVCYIPVDESTQRELQLWAGSSGQVAQVERRINALLDEPPIAGGADGGDVELGGAGNLSPEQRSMLAAGRGQPLSAADIKDMDRKTIKTKCKELGLESIGNVVMLKQRLKQYAWACEARSASASGVAEA